MVGRFTGACLGLLAFAITILAGLAVHNSPMVTLSRAVWALAIFCALGLVLGAAAQAVVNEHFRRREKEVLGGQPAQKTDETGAEQVPNDAAGGDSEGPEAAVVRPDAGVG
jgi:hypothetical protein